MNKTKQIGGLTLTVSAVAIALMMYFVITIDHWSDTKVERIEPACSTACAQATPVGGAPATGIKNTIEKVITPPQSMQDARDKYRKRIEYRARNLIGWT